MCVCVCVCTWTHRPVNSTGGGVFRKALHTPTHDHLLSVRGPEYNSSILVPLTYYVYISIYSNMLSGSMTV